MPNIARASYGLLGSTSSSGEGWHPESEPAIVAWAQAFVEGSDIASIFDLAYEDALVGCIRVMQSKSKTIMLVSVMAKGGEARNQKRHVFFDVSTPNGTLGAIFAEASSVLQCEGVAARSNAEATSGIEFEAALLRSALAMIKHLVNSPSKKEVSVGIGSERIASAIIAARAVTAVEIFLLLVDRSDFRPPRSPLSPQLIVRPIKIAEPIISLTENAGEGNATIGEILDEVKCADLVVGVPDSASGRSDWKRFIVIPKRLKPLYILPIKEVREWMVEILGSSKNSEERLKNEALDCVRSRKSESIDRVAVLIGSLVAANQPAIAIGIEQQIVTSLDPQSLDTRT